MILILDNYDSFTYNLVNYFQILGKSVTIYRNNVISVDEIIAMKPEAIIISPGPCSPTEAGISIELVEKTYKIFSILGICLGHQVIGHVFGGKIIKAPTPVHGKISIINHQQHKIFNNIPKKFNATRYHSLIIDPNSLSNDFEITSRTNDDIIMSISHRKLNLHGIQFHPESITTEYGIVMLKNFLEITNERNKTISKKNSI